MYKYEAAVAELPDFAEETETGEALRRRLAGARDHAEEICLLIEMGKKEKSKQNSIYKMTDTF